MSITGIRFSRRELNEWNAMTSSIDRNGNYKTSAILDSNGRPVPLDEFMEVTGQRTLQTRADFSKTPQEKEDYASAKAIWKNGMRLFFGENWRVVSKKVGYNNIPTDRETRLEVKKLISNLKLS